MNTTLRNTFAWTCKYAIASFEERQTDTRNGVIVDELDIADLPCKTNVKIYVSKYKVTKCTSEHRTYFIACERGQ